MLPQRITLEDLNVRGMMKNRRLSKAIQEQCFNMFVKYITYKCEEVGIETIKVPVIAVINKINHTPKVGFLIAM